MTDVVDAAAAGGELTYFIRAGKGGPIKIGRTIDLEERLRILQTGCPEPLILIGTRAGDQERFWHEKFAHLRIVGEWFEATEELIASLCASGINVVSAIPRSGDPSRLMVTAAGFGRMLGMSRAWVYAKWSAGLTPVGLKVGGTRLFSIREIEGWIEAGCPPRSQWQARQSRIASQHRLNRLHKSRSGPQQ